MILSESQMLLYDEYQVTFVTVPFLYFCWLTEVATLNTLLSCESDFLVYHSSLTVWANRMLRTLHFSLVEEG